MNPTITCSVHQPILKDSFCQEESLQVNIISRIIINLKYKQLLWTKPQEWDLLVELLKYLFEPPWILLTTSFFSGAPGNYGLGEYSSRCREIRRITAQKLQS
ncbi:unnamed protein product [Allacma fusca]|uniref:Uncharacterized protein n=1 Tax=Allacma fusca TaxID=39272 RepID=A0A8J2NTE0_9HEXA|nr:unnamed protein product [Allacma fusca]